MSNAQQDTESLTSRHHLRVVTPYRLDLTATVLRRMAMNVVDVWTADGEYLRALDGPTGPVVIRARQTRADAMTVSLSGAGHEPRTALALVRRMLGVRRDISAFQRKASRIPVLRDLVRRMTGVKPPRYPTLWEACVNAIVFQQVSLAAASTITRRLILSLGTPVESDGQTLYVFPGPEQFLAALTKELRAAGLSAAKLAALRGCAESILAEELEETSLEALPSADAVARLREIKGIGPWTAVVILLRGLGRLDVFPMNDTSVEANLALVAGQAPRARLDVARMLRALEPEPGMLYYYLLLARLESRGELGRPSR